MSDMLLFLMQVTRVYIIAPISTRVTAKSTAVPAASSEKSLTPSWVVSPPKSSKIPAKLESRASVHLRELRITLLSAAEEKPTAFWSAIPAAEASSIIIPRSILFDLSSLRSPFTKALTPSQRISGNTAQSIT